MQLPLLLSLALFSSQEAATLEAPAATSSAPLERALASFEEASVRADLEFLTSEELGGRGTPSLELRLAALFLRTRVERLGLEPGGEEGSYFHTYEIVRRSLDFEASAMTLQASSEDAMVETPPIRWRYGEDLFFSGPSELRSLDLSGGLVFLGSGADVDFESLELEGNYVLLLDEGRVRGRILRTIERAGAAGLIVAAGEGYTRDPYEERFERVLRGSVMSKTRALALRDPGMPRVYLADGRFEQLLAALQEGGESSWPAVGQKLRVTVHEKRVGGFEDLEERNVAALLPGSDPELAREVIVLSAHYDHLGRSGDSFYPGADDNASGTSGLLAIAGALAERGPLKRTVLMLWFSGEEKGLWGSEAWTKDPRLPEGARAVCNINVDMIGRTASDELYITPSVDHSFYNPLAERAYAVAPEEGFPQLKSQDEFWRASDHFNFARHLDIQTVFLSTGDHDDYHKKSDTSEKIDVEKLMRVARVVVRMVEGLQEPGQFEAKEK